MLLTSNEIFFSLGQRQVSRFNFMPDDRKIVTWNSFYIRNNYPFATTFGFLWINNTCNNLNEFLFLCLLRRMAFITTTMAIPQNLIKKKDYYYYSSSTFKVNKYGGFGLWIKNLFHHPKWFAWYFPFIFPSLFLYGHVTRAGTVYFASTEHLQPSFTPGGKWLEVTTSMTIICSFPFFHKFGIFLRIFF